MRFAGKEDVRRYVWNLLEERNIAAFPRPCVGRIPNFVGSEGACKRLKEVPEFASAKCVFSAPDYILTKARELVLDSRKILAVATPHMKKFLEISKMPESKIRRAASIRGFEEFGTKLGTGIDLFVQGSVAVDKAGNRIGKGKGYGDREHHVLKTLGMLKPGVKTVTIVHEVQLFDDLSHLMRKENVKIDYILTPERTIQVKKSSSLR
ncbi:MAG: 5-formyltetrahydrofolate cyclo-ligase [Thermoplasmata archaeon]|nr:5-formyltetrahydrofolate cyclo-ligase [Thermoplasmata archaeon]